MPLCYSHNSLTKSYKKQVRMEIIHCKQGCIPTCAWTVYIEQKSIYDSSFRHILDVYVLYLSLCVYTSTFSYDLCVVLKSRTVILDIVRLATNMVVFGDCVCISCHVIHSVHMFVFFFGTVEEN